MPNEFEYGAAGFLGITPPPSNPTVEPEMATLLPTDVTMLTTRLRGDPDNARQRFEDYLTNLENSLQGFGAIKLGAVGFACTATTYLLGRDAVNAELERLGHLFGYPIFSSAEAIHMALEELGARRIALFGPYPDWLQKESFAYWRKSGYDLVATAGIDLGSQNTLGIYRLRTSAIVEAASTMDWRDADAIVLTGTGAPTLRAVPELIKRAGKPVFSSNLCLGWSMLRAIGHKCALPVSSQGSMLVNDWTSRLSSS